MIEIGSKIKKLRTGKNLTQDQLASRLSVTKSVISAYENGLRFPSLEVLIQLSYVFNVTTDYLLGVNKKQVIDVSNLSIYQIDILNKLIDELQNKNT